MNKPTLVFHADWGSKESKRWCAKAILDADERYIVTEARPVGNPTVLLEKLRVEAGLQGIVFAGFDFPIGVPANYAECAGISKFRDFLSKLGEGKWIDFNEDVPLAIDSWQRRLG